jgi:hypothetical protein
MYMNSLTDLVPYYLPETLPKQRVPNGPSLPALAYVLRHRELWPEGFVWNFIGCETCAMGLAFQIWPGAGWRPETDGSSWHIWTSRTFGLSYEEVDRVFFRAPEAKDPSYHWVVSATMPFIERRLTLGSVTPEMVADTIDRFLLLGRT